MNSTKSIILIALGSALVWVGSAISIPIGPVPISLQTMMVVIVGMMLGPIRGGLAMLLYYLLGLIGIPVFAGFTSGIAVFTSSPAAGFLLGFLPAVIVSGLLFSVARRFRGAVGYVCIAVTAAIGMVLPYTLGIPVFMNYTGKTLVESLPLVVTPFIPGDVIKTVAATLVGGALLRFRGADTASSQG